MMLRGIRYRLRALRRAIRFDDADEYIYVFNHIPKCGGTAVRFVLAEWYAVVADYRKDFGERETREFIETKLDLSRIRRPAFVCGHYGLDGARLNERYPEVFADPRYRVMTFIRDPLDTAISGYFYARMLGRSISASNLDVYLTGCRTNFWKVLNCTERNYERVVQEFWFVGVTERLEESIRLLSSMLNKAYIEPPELNSTPRSETPGEEVVRIFRENNRLDYQIYDAACRRLEIERSRQEG
jgi:hypothetical protein